MAPCSSNNLLYHNNTLLSRLIFVSLSCVLVFTRRVPAWTLLLPGVLYSTSVVLCPWTVRNSFAPTAGPSNSTSHGRRQLLPELPNEEKTGKNPPNTKKSDIPFRQNRKFLFCELGFFISFYPCTLAASSEWLVVLSRPDYPFREKGGGCFGATTKWAVRGEGDNGARQRWPWGALRMCGRQNRDTLRLGKG